MKKIALASLLLLPVLASSGGCLMKLVDFAMYVKNGLPKFPAEFDQLPGKRVAVVCVSTSNAYGPGTVTNRISREVQSQLAANVEDIDVVRQEEIADWMDHHDWDRIDYVEVGRGVKADMVVAIELNQPLKLKEGPTLFKGQADFTTTVYDMSQRGKRVFRRRQEEFEWPNHGQYGVSETKFEREFIKRVGTYVARYFHPYEQTADIAGDDDA